jgi:hypothetical protein
LDTQSRFAGQCRAVLCDGAGRQSSFSREGAKARRVRERRHLRHAEKIGRYQASAGQLHFASSCLRGKTNLARKRRKADGRTDQKGRPQQGKLPSLDTQSLFCTNSLRQVIWPDHGRIIADPATMFAVSLADRLEEICLPFLGV